MFFTKKYQDDNARPLKPLIIPNKKAPEGANSNNGAPNGLKVDPIILQFSKVVSTPEFEYCLYNLSKIAA